MREHVGERFPSNRDQEILHVGKIGLRALCWGMNLFKHDVFLWPMRTSSTWQYVVAGSDPGWDDIAPDAAHTSLANSVVDCSAGSRSSCSTIQGQSSSKGLVRLCQS
jgi:hypothetical protein